MHLFFSVDTCFFLVTLGSKLMPLNSLIHSNFGPSLLTTKPCHSSSQKPLSEYRNRAPSSPLQGSTTQEAVVVNTLCWKHDYSAEKENWVQYQTTLLPKCIGHTPIGKVSSRPAARVSSPVISLFPVSRFFSFCPEHARWKRTSVGIQEGLDSHPSILPQPKVNFCLIRMLAFLSELFTLRLLPKSENKE